jgi:methyltransferase (TIGR00027 family)
VPEPLIRNVSDTALWVAVYRARESERPDALFNDPFAARLAGERGVKIVESLPSQAKHGWPMVARTWLGDRMIEECLDAGVDTVVNLAAGLDARPYRMSLPTGLAWIEVDLPDILAYKSEILRDASPTCRLERIECDLSDDGARRALFESLGRRSRNALVITEGLIIYLEPEKVDSLAKDLSAAAGFGRWMTDLASPSLLEMMRKQMGERLAQAPMKFGPPEGPAYFRPFGWRLLQVRSYFKTAAKLGRLPWYMRPFALLPESKTPWASRTPWGGLCLFEKGGLT